MFNSSIKNRNKMSDKFTEEILTHQNPQIAEGCKRFFKTQKGQYAYGDVFLGVPAPILRKIAKKHYKNLSTEQLNKVIKNKHHEIRACAIMAIVLKYKSTTDTIEKTELYNLYINNINNINNWDLVDISAAHIVGDYLYNFDRTNTDKILHNLAQSNNIWAQRIAIVSTHYFIKRKQYGQTLNIAKPLLKHNHDLMHKAIGWMLREIGKQDKEALIDFLNQNAQFMPRTMLRYAIEKFDTPTRKKYLSITHV